MGGPQDYATDVMMPDLLAGPGEWAFQGVDTAFFDGFFGYQSFTPADHLH
jgi:hypothetical protein